MTSEPESVVTSEPRCQTCGQPEIIPFDHAWTPHVGPLGHKFVPPAPVAVAEEAGWAERLDENELGFSWRVRYPSGLEFEFYVPKLVEAAIRAPLEAALIRKSDALADQMKELKEELEIAERNQDSLARILDAGGQLDQLEQQLAKAEASRRRYSLRALRSLQEEGGAESQA